MENSDNIIQKIVQQFFNVQKGEYYFYWLYFWILFKLQFNIFVELIIVISEEKNPINDAEKTLLDFDNPVDFHYT